MDRKSVRTGTHKSRKGKRPASWRLLALAAVLVGGLGTITSIISPAKAGTIPDSQKAAVTIQGQGALPNSEIYLSTGPSKKIISKADAGGNFIFANLGYASFQDLNFSLDVAADTNGLFTLNWRNKLNIQYHPNGANVRISGNIGRAGMITMGLEGAPSPAFQVAGEDGSISLQGTSTNMIASGQSKFVASIVNTGEICCTKLTIPATPITLTFLSVPQEAIVPATPVTTKPAETTTPPAPYTNTPSVPSDTDVDKDETTAPTETAPDEKPKKKKIPYVVSGQVQIETDVLTTGDIVAAGITFSQATYDNTYVGGIKKTADEVRNVILMHVAMLGAMIDGRNVMDSLRSIQVAAVETLKDYAPSDAICRFGTLTKSIALAENVVDRNKLALSKFLLDRNNQAVNTLYADPTIAMTDLVLDFKSKYCQVSDNQGFFDEFCDTATTAADVLFNRDVDFTRVFDVPLTFNTDFTDLTATNAADTTAQTNQRQALLALFHNLTYAPAYVETNGGKYNPEKDMDKMQDARMINAARQVSGNTFSALIAEKVKSKSESTVYMKAILTRLGVSATDATKLIGDNPSYFAQMEILTRKLFQNPEFYANLYDTVANIDRQRVAMKAIELQQDRDFLESLRRREMLLSTLLTMKLRKEVDRANESATMSLRKGATSAAAATP